MECPHCGHHLSKADQTYVARIVTTKWQRRWGVIKYNRRILFACAGMLLLWALILYAFWIDADSILKRTAPVDSERPVLQRASLLSV
ncbi:MAG: hypothetical protein HOP19_08965 [Acidobacteria bacterium]|nr:hypothetical protein [Acidobacteriota bacterium]